MLILSEGKIHANLKITSLHKYALLFLDNEGDSYVVQFPLISVENGDKNKKKLLRTTVGWRSGFQKEVTNQL